MPLGVELTGYCLFTTGVILAMSGIGIPKAVYSYEGHAQTTVDWMVGAILSLA